MRWRTTDDITTKTPRRHEREWSDRAGDEVRSWFGTSRSDRGSRWEGAVRTIAHTARIAPTIAISTIAASSRSRQHDAADEYYRAAREQRDDYLRRSEHNRRVRGSTPHDATATRRAWAPRERGGYWRQYEAARPHYAGRGPKDYQRSDDRIREEICDCMTDDPLLDASEIVVDVNERRGDALAAR